MHLPPSLATWREQLELFPQEIAVELGPLLQRLDLAIGPLRADSRHGQGEPDGFNGIARRGTYERLLISEWLLAEEVPEEFTRRALTGEHAFLQVARRTPATARACAALFDAGPEQWGSPRIAHLAALIVLSRRAEAAGVPFHWGALQDAPEPRTGLTEASIRGLLEARTPRRAGSADLEVWAKALGLHGPSDELWVVTGKRPQPLFSGVSLVEVEDPVDPDLDAVFASITPKGAAPRTVTLPLPEPRSCSRLLRDPFEAQVVAPQRTSHVLTPGSNLVFSVTGSKLYSRSGRALVAYPVPNSPRAGTGKPKLFEGRSERPVLAAGRLGKSTLLASRDNDTAPLRIQVIGGASYRIPVGDVSFEEGVRGPVGVAAGDAPPLGTIHASWIEGGAELFLHIGEMLYLVTNRKPMSTDAVGTVLAHGVAAAAPVANGIAWIAVVDGGWRLTTRTVGGGTSSIIVEGTGTRAFMGHGGTHADPDYGLVALEIRKNAWHVQNGEGVRTLTQWPDAEMVGVIAASTRTESPGLVMLEAGRRQLLVQAVDDVVKPPPAESPIRHVSVSPVSSRIAYTTEDGGLVIYSVEDRAVVYRLTAEGRLA